MWKTLDELKKEYRRLSRKYGTQAIRVEDTQGIRVGSVILIEAPSEFVWIIEPAKISGDRVKYREEHPDLDLRVRWQLSHLPKYTARYIGKKVVEGIKIIERRN